MTLPLSNPYNTVYLTNGKNKVLPHIMCSQLFWFIFQQEHEVWTFCCQHVIQPVFLIQLSGISNLHHRYCIVKVPRKKSSAEKEKTQKKPDAQTWSDRCRTESMGYSLPWVWACADKTNYWRANEGCNFPLNSLCLEMKAVCSEVVLLS